MTKTNSKAAPIRTFDPVIAEVRRIKVELLEKFGYDMAAMARDARARQPYSGQLVITRQNVT